MQILNENNNSEPNFSLDAKEHFPELVSKYGTAVEDVLLNSYENFSDMYSSPVKVNIKYKKAIERYKTDDKEFFEEMVKEDSPQQLIIAAMKMVYGVGGSWVERWLDRNSKKFELKDIKTKEDAETIVKRFK